MTTLAQQNQTFALPDGRSLGFAEFGSPDGKPLLYFHGYPSSRVEGRAADEMARRRGIRLIALDRPGFGLSSPQPGRCITDWPADVTSFAKGMDIDRFAILGVSGGGPFALACAHTLPRNMLAGVGLFASGPPWSAGIHHMTFTRRLTRVMAIHCPSVLKVVMNAVVGALRWVAASSWGVRQLDALLGKSSAKKKDDDQKVEDPMSDQAKADRRDRFMRLLVNEPFAQGADAAVLEAKLLSAQDWGFRFEDVEFDPVLLWHGAKDKNAPIAMIRHLAERVPHSVLHEFDDDTHYTMFEHLEDALAELMPEEAAKEPTPQEA